MMRNTLILVLMVLGTIQTYAFGTSYDVVLLNNDMVFKGEILKVKNCEVVFKAEGERYKIPVADVAALDFEHIDSNAYRQFKEAQADAEECAKAIADADAYHGKGGLHFALGALFGPFTVIGAAVSSPTPASGANTTAFSDNKSMFSDAEYLNCYKKKARGKNVGNSAAGWGAWVLLLLLL